MKLQEAIDVLNEINGQSYSYMKAWGLSTIKQAVRVARNRKNTPKEIQELADGIAHKIYMGSITPEHWS